MNRLKFISLACLFPCSFSQAHDIYEITLDAQQRRNRIEARLEMARSTSVAAIDPQPSLGKWWEPEEFPVWQPKLKEQAAALLQVIGEDGSISPSSVSISLNRENDVRIDYTFDVPKSAPSPTVNAALLSRFSEEGFGVRVTFRDKTGYWHPPFLIFQDKPEVPLP